jgi:hypothetical protein
LHHVPGQARRRRHPDDPRPRRPARSTEKLEIKSTAKNAKNHQREILKIQFFTEGNQENKEDGRENNLFKFLYFQSVIKNKAFCFNWFSSFPSLPSVQFLEVP